MSEILVLSTTDTHELARTIASALVEAREAACVNIVPNLQSVYRWEGKVRQDGEFLLMIKSTSKKLDSIKARIRSLHTYELPELIAIPIADGDPAYLAWIRSSVDKPS